MSGTHAQRTIGIRIPNLAQVPKGLAGCLLSFYKHEWRDKKVVKVVESLTIRRCAQGKSIAGHLMFGLQSESELGLDVHSCLHTFRRLQFYSCTSRTRLCCVLKFIEEGWSRSPSIWICGLLGRCGHLGIDL